MNTSRTITAQVAPRAKREMTTLVEQTPVERELCESIYQLCDQIDRLRDINDELLDALERLFRASKNELILQGLPLEWTQDSAMSQAEATIHKVKETKVAAVTTTQCMRKAA